MKRVKGQSIFEIVLAIGIVGVVMVALVGLVVLSQRNVNSTKERSEATRMIQEATEWLRGERDRDWTAFYNRTSGNSTYCLNSSPPNWSARNSCGGPMSGKTQAREVSFVRDPSNPDSVRADIRVVWSDFAGQHQIKSSTHFTNWRNK